MPSFPEKVLDILNRTGVDSYHLLFEVAESAPATGVQRWWKDGLFALP
jgi:hypothetical protein